MNRKNLLLLAVIIAGTLAIMAGCTSPQFGAPGTTGAAITGRVATPESCFSDACDNPFITEGKPLPGATALFYGGDSGKLKIEGETECDGAFEVNTTGEGSYVLYVVREYPEGLGKYVVVKKGVNNPRGDVGEANAYTTSQVIIWERANALYGEDFVPFDASWYAQYDWKWSFAPAKLVLPVSEIPNLEPSTQLYNAVEKALSECRDPQEDNRVIHFADQIADATFGAPGGGGAAGGGGGGAITYTLTINYVYSGGGQAAPSHAANLAEGAAYNVTSPTVSGYTPDQAVVSGTMPASNVTVTVIYSENPTYSVTYDANGGSGAPTDPNSPYYAGNTVTVASGVPTKTGYTFAGWSYGGNTYYAGHTFTMPGSDVTLVAQWTQNTYKVYYDANEGINPPTDSNSYYAGNTVTVASGVPTKTGYTFAGWSYGGNTYYAGHTFTMPGSDVTLVAQWTQNPCCVLSYDSAAQKARWDKKHEKHGSNQYEVEVKFKLTTSKDCRSSITVTAYVRKEGSTSNYDSQSFTVTPNPGKNYVGYTNWHNTGIFTSSPSNNNWEVRFVAVRDGCDPVDSGWIGFSATTN